MGQVTHWKPMKASGAIAGFRIVQVAGNNEVGQSVAASKDMIGVSGREAVKAAETVEIAITGVADVTLGGAVAAGAHVKSDADGKAVATTTSGDHIIGICIVGGVEDDIGEILLAPGTYG